jgi:4-hydroxybenzoyl-CoA thioesterase
MAFRTAVTLRFGDIDLAGVLYYPRFLHYVHVAMEEFFALELGRSYAAVVVEDRFGLPAVHLETDFRRPLRYGDRVEIEVRVTRVGRTSVAWRYVFLRNGEAAPAAEVRVVTAGIDLDTFTARRLPDWLRDRLVPLIQE